MLNLISKSISFLFSEPALLKAVICKKGVLCSSPRIKFIQVTFKSVLTWAGNNRIDGCSLEKLGPTSKGLTLLGEPQEHGSKTSWVFPSSLGSQVLFVEYSDMFLCFFTNRLSARYLASVWLTVFCSMERNAQTWYVANYIHIL